ncbi:MAG: sigma-54-dependent transcriptional regulator [Alphaproteobacteria bacterium]
MRLLIVGSPVGPIAEAGKIAHARGAKVSHAETVEQAMHALRTGKGADLIMADVRQDIGQLVELLKHERFSLQVVACGINTDALTAVKAIRAGAKEYIPLPPDPELIAAVLSAVSDDSKDLIFGDPVMGRVIALAAQIAKSEATVLITGESGTGKEVIAQHVHKQSKRAGAPFISVNCAAIPDNLLESELFGYEKGAFTGANARRIGKFEEANGGTLLLDEISEMDIRLQAKLLRAIQERVIDRLGGNQPVKVDIRLIATSNRKLEDYVREGKFREDLYYRLNVVNLALPALRERPGDIKPLAEFFVKKYSKVNGFDEKTLSPETVKKLVAYQWKGNVRELENTMHRAVLLSPEDIVQPDAVMFSGQSLTSPPVEEKPVDKKDAASSNNAAMVGRTVAEVERELIIDTLHHCLGNRTHAATILGISIRTLRNKLKEYTDQGLEVPLPGENANYAHV